MKSWIEDDGADNAGFAFHLASLAASGEHPVPERILRRLEGLSLLEGVPFLLLAPRPDMLPDESLRFFHLDGSWLFALLDGALSPGRSLRMDLGRDAAILEGIFQKVLDGRTAVRRRKQGRPPPLPDAAVSAEADGGGGSSCTGFLLRSALVRGWRGLEFKAFADAEGRDELAALRLETLSGDVLLGLYRGVVRRLEIRQPPESFHFGIAAATGGGFRKRLRDLTSGVPFGEGGDVSLALRGGAGNRVLDMAAAAAAMTARLGTAVTSAEFAVEMIENGVTGIITES